MISPIFFRKAILLAIFAVCGCMSSVASGFTLVIDPGHGKQDFGAVGKITNEKSINLAVALKLGKLIKENMPDVKIVYTRNNDTFVPLQGRADIANKAKGDLFISIHANSIDKRAKNYRTIAGASVYTLGFRRSEENLAVAMRENAVMKLESDYSTTYEGFDPNSTESYIIFEMSQNKHMEQSIEAANEIQKELVSTAGRKDRGVRQANFWVLFKTSMPAILVELDFICNPEMERFMNSESGQNKLATAIYNGFARYKAAEDKRVGNATAAPKILTAKSATALNDSQEAKATRLADSGNSKNEQSGNTPIIYKVQFLVSSKKLSAGSPKLKGIGDADYYTDGGMIKYTTGAFESEQDAAQRLVEVRKTFPDAFIIKTQGNKRIK